jgi:uncharacterized surface protein with fasciclin (FAS1) repeats
MQHLAIAAAATALFIGAGTGAMTSAGPNPAKTYDTDVLNPMVAGRAMLAEDSIFDNAAKSPEHTSFVAEVRAAGLADMLKGKGPYTVFAPTDAAYEALTPAARAQLGGHDAAMKSAGYLVVRGRFDSQTLLKLINENEGVAKLKTLEGGTITATMNGPTNIALMDGKGDFADIAIYDIYQSNGVIQVVDKVMLPG